MLPLAVCVGFMYFHTCPLLCRFNHCTPECVWVEITFTMKDNEIYLSLLEFYNVYGCCFTTKAHPCQLLTSCWGRSLLYRIQLSGYKAATLTSADLIITDCRSTLHLHWVIISVCLLTCATSVHLVHVLLVPMLQVLKIARDLFWSVCLLHLNGRSRKCTCVQDIFIRPCTIMARSAMIGY